MMLNRIFQILCIVFLLGLFVLYILAQSPPSSPLTQLQKLRQLNNKTASKLNDLVKSKFFRILRLNVNANCPIPLMNRLCRSKSCSVCRCDQKDIPQNWRKTDKVVSSEKEKDVWSKQREQKQENWVWHVEDEENDKGEYFDVNINVQSYSGYNGSYIWSLIYEENCFKGANLYEQMCSEEKVLYRIISGLHTSISSHLSRLHKNITEVALWADKGDQNNFYFNHHEYNERVLRHPERISNLLFLYEMLVRSIKQIVPFLEQNNFISSDNIAEDLQATKLVDELVRQIKNVSFKPLNETDAFFFVPNNPLVKQYQKYIHNISNILNCVDCQKCRLFGKMQTYGIGTALKVLLGYNTPYKRNEIVAIFNTLNKISISVNTYFNYRQLLGQGVGGEKYRSIDFESLYKRAGEKTDRDQYIYLKVWGACGGVLLSFLWVVSKWSPQAKIKRQFRNVSQDGNEKRKPKRN